MSLFTDIADLLAKHSKGRHLLPDGTFSVSPGWVYEFSIAIANMEREACAITGGAAADAGLDGREVANAIRMRSNVEVQRDSGSIIAGGSAGTTGSTIREPTE